MKTKKKTVFFDRDGTLIVNQHYLNDPNLIVYLPGAFEALQLLRDNGYQLVMVTNQSGIARGIVSIENLEEIHRRMVEEYRKHGVEFAGIYVSPHAGDSNHPMRKPNPGMLLQADQDLGVDFSQSWMVGDNISDVEAGHRAGCRSVLLAGSGSENSNYQKAEISAPDLMSAIKQIIRV